MRQMAITRDLGALVAAGVAAGIAIGVAAGISALAPGPARAQDAAAQANNPIADTQAVSFQNLYAGELTGINRDANQFYFRYALPFRAMGAQWLMRATLPVNSFPGAGGGTTTGIGDLNILAAYTFDTGNPAVSFGIGPQFTLPTASDDAVGAEKWQAGLANVLFNATDPTFQWGYLLTWQASFAGDDDRDYVSLGAFQPFLFYQLGQGWYLRSTGVWTYNFASDAYSIPVGLGLGKVVKSERAVVNAFVEPQYSVATHGDGQPEWGAFAGLNFQF